MIGILEDDSTTGMTRSLIDDPGPQNLIVGDAATHSVQGRRRLRNEDAWAQLGPVFAVADGMGGLEDGHVAAATTVDHVTNAWLRAQPSRPEDVVIGANRAVRSQASDRDHRSGSTLSAVRFGQDRLTILHVGDSRIYRLRDGAVQVLTRDHNIRSELLAAGIDPQGDHSYGPLRSVTRYVGMPEHELVVDVRSIGLRPLDRIVLCTDGVFNGLSHADFGRLASDGDASQAAVRLTGRDSSDDATATVIDVISIDDTVRR